MKTLFTCLVVILMSIQTINGQADQPELVADSEEYYYNKHRSLRSGSKSKPKSPAPKTAAPAPRPSSTPPKTANTGTTSKKTTTTKITKRTVVSTNSYWNASAGRTYQPLVVGVYFRPVGAYIVYYSPFYGMTYYNGYGWNFYSQQGGYYDCAVGPTGLWPPHCQAAVAPAQGSTGGSAVVAVVVIIVVLCICACLVYAVWKNRDECCADDVEEEEVVEEEVVVEEIEVVEETTHNNQQPVAYPQGYDGSQPPPSAPPGYP